MSKILIKNGKIVNRGHIFSGDILVKNGFIEKVAPQIDAHADVEINAEGKWVLPGIIDDQVHFREPGVTYKADIYSESKAAVAGGVTSFMEMPNTKPQTVTQEALAAKYALGAQKALANYSFYMGATNDNLEEVLRTNPKNVCGIKVFMGASTGNMLVDEPKTLEGLFANVPLLIATHSEDESIIRANEARYRTQYGDDIPVKYHPLIRSAEGCFKSSSLAMELAKKYDARLHILHLSTKDEIALFRNDIPLKEKRITAEVCVHHLYFNSDQYETLGTGIKCNPAIKAVEHQEALFEAMLDDHFDIIATDHAPHTMEEKQNAYFSAPSGLPLVQHSLNIMIDFHQKGKISLERLVEKMCHAPAICFQVDKRGYLDEGYWADIVIFDPEKSWTVGKENILYKCQWSPLEGKTFKGSVETSMVSGHLAYHNGQFNEQKWGERILFNR